ncbi:MAG: hypothetical protein KJO96_05765 [Winogradskyella sp.]|nr:hypothetical protein [Winogradskyella sp.]NNF86070.1 hypothetical protein [Winogradskyella sp.]NNL82536.1 hypothetical protein [Winogradskyella sp.]
MKTFFKMLCIVLISWTTITMSAQNQIVQEQLINDYSETLTNTDTIPEFNQKQQQLKLQGIIYENDGVTPAKDVILYISHADEDGDFDVVKKDGKRYVTHRGWVKTDSDGRYTFYTFIPGNDRTYNQLQEIYPLVKAPGKAVYEVPSFLFDSDPLLSKYCRKRMAKKDDITRILKTKEEQGILVATRNIILPTTQPNTKEGFSK